MNSLAQKWKVYSMEAICLGLFMISASLFGTLLEYPESPFHRAIENGFARTVIMGVAMGLTATLINYSPMGRLSGAHMNPAVSFTFVGLGKMKIADAIYYSAFQIGGGIAAVLLMRILLGSAFENEHVNFVITAPGKYGVLPAFVIEVVIAFGMMTMVLITSNHRSLSKYTGAIAGLFVMTYVIISGPVSGFGMNPARTLASAVPAMQYPSLWIYLTAPFIGMFGAAWVYKYSSGVVKCAKMHHAQFYQCIFNCDYCKHEGSESTFSNVKQ